MNMRRIFLYFMTGAVLALAGCGGNGGGAMPMMQVTPISVNTDALLPAPYRNMMAGTFDIRANQNVTRDDVTFTCGGTGMSICRVTVTAAGMVSVVGGTLENNQFKPDASVRVNLTLASTQAARTRKANADKAAADMREREMREAAARTAAEDRAYGLALTGARFTNDVRAIQENWDADDTRVYGIVVGRATNNNPLGDTLNVQPEAHLTAANTPEFMKQGTDTMLGGFKGEVHTKTVTKGDVSTKTNLMIYNNKAATGPIPYNVYYAGEAGDAANPGSRPHDRIIGGSDPTSGDTLVGSGSFHTSNSRLAITRVDYGDKRTGRADSKLNGVLTLKFNGASGATNVLTAAETALVQDLPGTPDVDKKFPYAPGQIFNYGGSSGGAKATTFDGTFNGIPGKFNCTGMTTCSAERLNNGTLQLRAAGNLGGTVSTTNRNPRGTLAAGWYFTPTATASSIMLPNLDYDTDYLTFGYWLAEETETGEPTTYQIRTFGTGSMPFDTNTGTGDNMQNAALQLLTGTASYAGGATGHYQHHVIQADGTPTPGQSSQGQFTATATLMARFGLPSNAVGSVAVNDLYSISGNLTNFKAIGHSNANLLSGWAVELEKAKFGYRPNGAGGMYATNNTEVNYFPYGPNANRGGRTTATLGKTATSPGTAGATKGNWRGTFFGPTANSAKPSGVAGTFDANFSNGKAVGAYGATRQQQ